MPSSLEIVERLRMMARLNNGFQTNAPLSDEALARVQDDLEWQAANLIERLEASLSTAQAALTTCEAGNTFLQGEIDAAAQRQKALAPRENEAGEGQ